MISRKRYKTDTYTACPNKRPTFALL